MKIVIIGYGGMGAYHYGKIAERSGLEIVGVYDIKKERRDFAVSQGLYSYESEEELYAKKDEYDAVLIATPNDIHPYYVEKIANFKKHIICEKPAANSSKEFMQMVKNAEENGVILMVHQNRRWDSDFLTAKKAADSGLVGKAYRVESRVMGGNGIPGDWRKVASAGGGMMLDWGVHLIDQACQWTKAKIVSMDCEYSYVLGFEVDDGFRLTIKFDDGLTYVVVVDTNTFSALPRWVAYGMEGTIEVTDWQNNGQIVVKKDYTEKLVGIKAGNGFTKTMATRPVSGTSIYDLSVVDVDDQEFYKDFKMACDGVKPPSIKNDEVLRVLRIMEKAFEIATSKRDSLDL